MTGSESSKTRDDPTSRARLLSSDRLAEVRDLLGDAGLDAWLLYDFRDQNPIAHELLGLGKTTRRSYVLLPREGDPVVVRHQIEASAWSHVPWEQRPYAGWRSLEREVAGLLEGGPRVAMEFSESDAVPTVDRVPAGVLELVRACGGRVSSSADLVSQAHSRWTSRELELHRIAAEVVRSVALAAFERAATAAQGDDPLRERELMDWIIGRLAEGGLTEGAGCIVAGDVRSSDPHYEPDGAGESLTPDSLVLIDLWGRHAGGVFADQTWMGVLAREAPERVRKVWEAVRGARDAALDLLTSRAVAGEPVHGFEVDAEARSFLGKHGMEDRFVHRLGHSIDHELHGSGPNLDDLETRDERRLVPGIGFSVEPGVYLPGAFGVRSEVNVYWGSTGPEITPGSTQQDLLLSPAP